jgi:hypothetical protein
MAKKHWISVKRGLSEDPKHREQMGMAIWGFLHMIDRADWETGIVYDWRDKDEAEDMGLNERTLRDWRQRLAEKGYISCKQNRRGLDITIYNWINPKEYSGGIINRKGDTQGDMVVSPTKIKGDTEVDTQGDTEVREENVTPTIDSKIRSQRSTKNSPAPVFDFKNMTVGEARKVPTLKLYIDATEQFPSSVLWETVHNTITEKALTFEQLRSAAVAWIGKGYRPENVTGILEWAVNGIPVNGNGSKSPQDQKPAINENAIERTRAMADDKWNFRPAPPPAVRPAIKQLAVQKSVRK